MSRLDPLLADALDALSRRRMRRSLRAMAPGDGAVRHGDHVLINASGNDYLGLSHHPALAARAAEWGARLGTGSGASRLVTGTFDAHLRVEARIAEFKKCEAALLFASGWQLNAAVLPALLRAPGRGGEPIVFADRLIHASLHHGIAAAGARETRFRHNDLDHLEALLMKHAGVPGQRFIVTESVFSMDGDRADLARLKRLADAHDTFLYVDEAHATGVLGPAGAGLSVEAGGVDLVMGTLSKAFGGFGAYLAGSQVLCDWIVNRCSGFIHTTALPPTVLGAMDAALDLVPAMDAERLRLQDAAGVLRGLLNGRGIDTGPSTTQIVPVMVREAEGALALAHAMERDGVLGIAIRPPTVPPHASRIRLALGAAHDDETVRRIATVVSDNWCAGS